MPLLGCVDCHKALSPNAKVCSGCQSQDPFGSKRRQVRLRAALIGIFFLGTASAAMSYTGSIRDINEVLKLAQDWFSESQLSSNKPKQMKAG